MPLGPPSLKFAYLSFLYSVLAPLGYSLAVFRAHSNERNTTDTSLRSETNLPGIVLKEVSLIHDQQCWCFWRSTDISVQADYMYMLAQGHNFNEVIANDKDLATTGYFMRGGPSHVDSLFQIVYF